MLTAALVYAQEFGWPVLPVHYIHDEGACSCHKSKCDRPGKHPLTDHGYKDASTDPETVERWWRRWPDANLAMATGRGIFVLDIDNHPDGDDGYETLRKWEAEHGELPETVTQLTGGGGTQYLYTYPEGVTRIGCRTALGPGIDCRADGGYAILPPSIHPSGRAYGWQADNAPNEIPMAVLPIWLYEKVKGATVAPLSTSGGNGTGELIPSKATLLFMERGAPVGHRNDRLYAAACDLAGCGYSPEQATEKLTPAALGAGLDAQETERTIASAYSTDRAPAAPVDHRCTDVGNAQRLVHHFGKDFRHCSEIGTLVWTGQRWERDTTGRMQQFAKGTALKIYDEASPIQDEARRKDRATWAKNSESAKRLRDMVALALTEPGIPVAVEDLDASPMLLAVEDGTIDLETGKLLPHRRGDLITELCPVAYDPDAVCPSWDRFPTDVTNGDVELIAFLQRAVGYSLTADTSEQCLFFLYGLGCNGKTTFLRTVLSVLGAYGQQADFSTFMVKRNERIPNDIARLAGSRFVCATEVEVGKHLAEVLVKQLTGGDTVTARFLHREFFDFLPAFKMWLGGNHKPVIRGTDLAIWRRIRLVPFTVTIPESKRDTHLVDKLHKERAGVLAWAVRGCLEWQQGGLGTPGTVKDATAAYRNEMDSLGDFIEGHCLLAENAVVATKALYPVYKDWCERSGERALSRNVLGARLTERGFDQTRIGPNRDRGYAGIGLRPDGPTTPTTGGHQISCFPQKFFPVRKTRESASMCGRCVRSWKRSMFDEV